MSFVDEWKKCYYDYYVAVLSYLYCPSFMQIPDQVDRIVSLLSDICYQQGTKDKAYRYMECVPGAFYQACDFVSMLYHEPVTVSVDDVDNFSCDRIMSYLRHNARSEKVKSYFGLDLI